MWERVGVPQRRRGGGCDRAASYRDHPRLHAGRRVLDLEAQASRSCRSALVTHRVEPEQGKVLRLWP